ncbi:MAG TPA: DUF1801 domain-containing protein [Saprospiraceae bacterium]|nr:DUF1801 domain-containing protein [Saprospiraceae bacterium]HMX88136.1 DUF1801 domain-containing protein [Saprospiraceae bacterium]HMZ38897.1 DUF1801 domain-containing protein [Saprospiraceae bacterium]HNA64945.1 DUF1801 domain-containing protein [Saprospiraceae bacterium]HNB30504.1 DUF1801 domain-containing protein [Saprospiraceae bacterium]
MVRDAFKEYHLRLSEEEQKICSTLASVIGSELPDAESKIWHSHPVWFLDGNPITGYDKLKQGIRLMFWSGADFEEPMLLPGTGKFKDASIRFTVQDQIDVTSLKRWLAKSRRIQWDYKNLVKRKGQLLKMNTLESKNEENKL